MTFEIPNAADAAARPMAGPDNVDFDILAAALVGDGVVAGCVVTITGTPDEFVQVALGTVSKGRDVAAVTAAAVKVLGSSPGQAADANNPRFTLIVSDSAGALSQIHGAAAKVPAFPEPGANIVLAAVYVPAGSTTVDNIDGKTPIVQKQAGVLAAVTFPTLPVAGTTRYVLPGWCPMNAGIAGIGAVSKIRYIPFFVGRTTTYIGIACQVTTGMPGFLTDRARMVIYSCVGGLPAKLILDAGTVDSASTGIKEIVISLTLEPGYYFAGLQDDTASVYLGMAASTVLPAPISGVAAAFGFKLNLCIPVVAVGTDYVPGGFPATAEAPDALETALEAIVKLRES